MFEKLKVWMYSQSPSLWENVAIAMFVVFIVIVGVN
jgi:hypothetical protein